MNNFKNTSESFWCTQLLGTTFAQTKKYPQAVEFLSKALQVNPITRLYTTVAMFCKNSIVFDEALTVMTKRFTQADHAEAYNNRGTVLQELKRLDEALTSYDKAIHLNADYAEAYYNRGIVLKKLKRLDEHWQVMTKPFSSRPIMQRLTTIAALF